MVAKIIYIISVVAECILVPLFIRYSYPERCKKSLILKSAASVTFVVIGICSILASGKFTSYSKFILIGLIFGLAGDVVIHLLTENRLITGCGGVLFFIGHIFYILAYGEALNSYTPGAEVFDWRTVTVLLIVVFSCFIYYIIKDVKLGKLAVPILIYGILITLMLITAIQVSGRFFLEGENNDIAVIFTVGLGSVLFFLSDITFALIHFGGKEKNIPLRAFSSITYYTAQILLATSTMFIFGVQK